MSKKKLSTLFGGLEGLCSCSSRVDRNQYPQSMFGCNFFPWRAVRSETHGHLMMNRFPTWRPKSGDHPIGEPTTLAATSESSPLYHASTCLCMGSKFRCMRSIPSEMRSISENDFEYLASTGVTGPDNVSKSAIP